MKALFFQILVLSSLSFYGCQSGEDTAQTKHFPKPGAVITSAEMPVTDDTLNDFVFSVKIIADSNVTSGVYDVDADFGPNYAQGQFTMPKGGEYLLPVIRKGNTPYTYIIGFRLPDDTTFYEYFEVSSNKQVTKMQYIKAYEF